MRKWSVYLVNPGDPTQILLSSKDLIEAEDVTKAKSLFYTSIPTDNKPSLTSLLPFIKARVSDDKRLIPKGSLMDLVAELTKGGKTNVQ